MIEKTLKISRLLELYGNLLTDKQKEGIELYYNCDMSLSEIGSELGISRQGVRDSIMRATNALLDFEDKLGCFARLSKIKNELESVAQGLEGEERARVLAIANETEV